MKRRFTVTATAIAALVAIGFSMRGVRAQGPGTVALTLLGSGYSEPIGIDWLPIQDQLLISVNYDTGFPHNFDQVNRTTGAVMGPFSSATGWSNEIYFSTVRPGQPGGWTVGDVLSAEGDGTNAPLIARFNSDGVVTNPFATLVSGSTAETKQKRGGVVFDRYGVAGGDLIVIASNDGNSLSTVWRVTSGGVATRLVLTGPGTPGGNYGCHLEGVTTIPNELRYGVLAGTILAGAEYGPGTLCGTVGSAGAASLVAINPATGATVTFTSPTGSDGQPIEVEDIWVVPANHDFYGVDHNENAGPKEIWKVDASQWASAGLVGKILLATEHAPTGGGTAELYVLDIAGGEPITGATRVNSGQAVQWEHITFAPIAPQVTIVKFTNTADANDPNAAGVPNIAPGGTVTWTYRVTNTGGSQVPRAQVIVTDNTTGVTPTFTSEISGNGDTIFDPAEIWLYTATGTAVNLTLPPAGVITVANSCTAGGTQPPRTAYTNVGTVTIPGASATDPSSYCNPPTPRVTIVKFTNTADANDPNAAGVPNIVPGGAVTWTYRVTNTGNSRVPRAQVIVTDNTTGVSPTFTSEISGNGDTIFDPAEVWLYTATGTAVNLTLPPAGVHTVASSCTAGGTQPPRTAYTNIGTVTIPGASATDPSSYCNPPPSNPEHGCTPGFWKNHATIPPWGNTYKPSTLVGSVFTVPNGIPGHTAFSGETLLTALDGGGGSDLDGKTQILLRAAVAAVLNADNGNPVYPYTVAQIKSLVNAALASLNETTITNLGTDLDTKNNKCDTDCGNPPTPYVTIVKLTNGVDANNPNLAGVPNIAPGGAVTWTYSVTNTGSVSVPKASVVVTDNQPGVSPLPVLVGVFVQGDTNTNNVLDPSETWVYRATGTAVNLTAPPAGVITVANSCTAGGTQPSRTAYKNIGTVTIPGASATDPSSYCNPPPAAGAAPVITTNPSNLTVNAGQMASFSAAASGVPTPTVKWQVSTGGPFTDIPGATSTTYSFTALSGDNGKAYRAVFTNATNSATTSAATLTVTSASTQVLAVSKSGTGTGTVTSSPAGISCGATCSASFASGSNVTLAESPAAGSTFAGWSGGCTGTGSCMVTMSSGQSVTAQFTLQAGPEATPGDFDGDGKTDLPIWRPSTGTWFWLTSMSGYNYAAQSQKQWGNQSLGDVPLSGDIDGDGIMDLILWRASTGTFFWLTSSSGYNYAAQGQKQLGNQSLGDVPMLADMDGDGQADLVVWRASTGTWYWLTSLSGYDSAAQGQKQWGNQSLGDVPMLADMDGDHRADLVVWRASTGTWFWLTSLSGYDYAAQGQKQWGNAGLGDMPMLGDTDGDGKADLTVWRASTGTWFWLTSLSGYDYAAQGQKQWGNDSLGDIPMLGDMDGDHRADLVVWRESTGTWFWLTSGSGYNYAVQGQKQWGTSGDIPMIK